MGLRVEVKEFRNPVAGARGSGIQRGGPRIGAVHCQDVVAEVS